MQTPPVSRFVLRWFWTWGLLVNVVLGASAAEPRRVLIIHSFGREFAPFDTMTSAFRTELARQSPDPVEFYEASLLTMRVAEAGDDRPLLRYLQEAFAERRLDLMVSVAEPATHFCVRHRAELFPDTPLLAHVDRRQAPHVLAATNAFVVPVQIDLPLLIENILQVLPGTTNVALVLGASPMERYWTDLCRREFSAFTHRITFSYLNDLPLEAISEAVGRMPPNSAILYGMLAVDAAGVPYEQERALATLRNAANAPVFGPFASQMGQGIVGGRLISLEASGRQAAQVALRVFRGEDAGVVAATTSEALREIYDWRELRRWNISSSRVPASSEVRFRVPTFWEQYKWRLIGIHALCLAEGGLIFALLRNRRRLQRTQRRLRQSEERLHLATNSAKVGVWSWNIREGTIDATAECQQMFGFATGTAVTFAEFLERVYPDDRVPVQRALEEARTSGSVYDMQYRIALPDGQVRWIAARGRGRGAAGAASDMLGVVLDITARKAAENEVQRHRQELAHVSRVSLMGELSASMAHELNQPLTAILTNAQAAQRFMASGRIDIDEFREILTDIARDTTRARDVIRHLRALVKKSEPHFTRLDLGETLRDVMGFLHGDSVARNVRVELDLAPDLPPIRGDRIQIEQVLINLLINAFDAMNGVPVPDRMVKVTAAREAPAALRVTVRDQGTGIPPDQLEAIFEPFVTTKSEGMGMGLSVTRSILESHHGRIRAHNNPDGGATLEFTLPAAVNS